MALECKQGFGQTLNVDTSITNRLDMSKFPGLDNPHLSSQPALLIASPTRASADKGVEYSPTKDFPAGHDDLLGDILSVIEKHDMETAISSGFQTPSTMDNLRIHQSQSYNHKNTISCHHPASIAQQSSVQSPGSNAMSKYAMDMIFNQLIYPDVSVGKTFNLDTLIQSAPAGHTARFESSGYHQNRLLSAPYTSLRHGKRKRVYEDQTRDEDSWKRNKYESSVAHPGAWKNTTTNYGLQPRRLLLG